ncbi:MAG: M48 family metallopeptidase [Leptospirillia bacterium]
MDFFEAQDVARRRTGVLVVLFLLAVAALILMANLLVLGILSYQDPMGGGLSERLARNFDWGMFLSVGVGVIAVVTVGTLYKLSVLSGGGRVVAESLGGKRVPRNTDDLKLKRLMNVVEEMAIASGTPVPPVYVMPYERGINAFAAGTSTENAVIGVTRGAVVELDRNQLQGVIAHEFSHILNGDMRLNIRLMGILHGILLLGLIGQFILRGSVFGGRRRGSHPAVLGVAIGLMAVGYGGTFFGNLIKAGVSRQREFLADASAVQFTRDPSGIAGALKRIGGLAAGARMASPAAPEASHAFFGEGVTPVMGFLFATHPPLKDRIRRIDKHWDGRFDTRPPTPDEARGDLPEGDKGRQLKGMMGTVVTATIMADAVSAVNRVGHPTPEQLEQARALLARIPPLLTEATSEPYGARAVIYALVCDPEANDRQRQFAHLDEHGDTGIADLTRALYPLVAELPRELNLPLVEMALPVLSDLSESQHRMFRENLAALIRMDAHISLFEWCIGKVVTRHLDVTFHQGATLRRGTTNIRQAVEPAAVVLSMLAYLGEGGSETAGAAFEEAQRYLQLPAVKLMSEDVLSVALLDGAIDALAQLTPLHKRRFLRAAVACIRADGIITADQMELMRVVSATVGAPMPPPEAAGG